jgi:hypothetical protein
MKLGHIVGAALAMVAWALFPGCGNDPAAPAGDIGESCQSRIDCVAGLLCLNNACSRPVEPVVDDAGSDASVAALVVHSQAGESCAARIDCVVGLLCINNVCTKDDPNPDAGEQTGAGKRGESCRTRGDCAAGLACVNGVCAKADFGIASTANECVQIDCMVAKDCCPRILPLDPATCALYQGYCEGGTTFYCTQYNTNCKCNEDNYTCTADNKCVTKTTCSDSGINSCGFGFFCNGGTECVRCLKNEDCGADQTCTPQHTCLVNCLKNSDCPYLFTCNAGACADTGCTDDRECIAKTRSPLSVCAKPKCKTPCQTDAECNIGGAYQYSACVTGFCQDVGCKTDEECRIRLNLPVPSNKQAKCQPKK